MSDAHRRLTTWNEGDTVGIPAGYGPDALDWQRDLRSVLVGRDDAARFLNALKIMRALDWHELQNAGIEMDGRAWQKFSSDPPTWAMKASDADYERLFALIEARQPARAP